MKVYKPEIFDKAVASVEFVYEPMKVLSAEILVVCPEIVVRSAAVKLLMR